MSTLLQVENLTTRFYTQDGVVHAVNGISYTLAKGESLALVGESGCGKSVSALSLIGLVPSPPGKVEHGRVLFDEQDLLQLPERQLRRIRGRDIAMIFQDPMTSLNPVLTVGRQVMESLRLHLSLSRTEARQRATELLEMVGIPDAERRLDDYPHQFSGGQRQRINIAMALACRPALLIADEPTTALDVTIQAQIVSLIKELKAELGMSVIWITHDMGVVASLVNRVAVMYAGTIVEMAPVLDLYEQTSHPYTLGLLESLPKVNQQERQRLQAIEGAPPDLLTEVKGCPFADRCAFVEAHCQTERPSLELIDRDHHVACWRWPEVRQPPRPPRP
ncbi:MAG TPA: ABC transporter ATP-binding protein [Chloroflexota bacterium]|nr:ABC transporter ATP-binding protein [Chloroflexota bacterium]